MATMPQDAAQKAPVAGDEVDKFLNEQKTLEAHRQELIKEVLHQKEAAMKAFDERLAKLGYTGGAKAKRSHHKKASEGSASA